MRIKMMSIYASPQAVLQPGDEADVNDDLAQTLIAGGFAVAVKRQPESQVLTQPEKAIMTPAKNRRVRD